jgi:hypothetical protein
VLAGVVDEFTVGGATGGDCTADCFRYHAIIAAATTTAAIITNGRARFM